VVLAITAIAYMRQIDLPDMSASIIKVLALTLLTTAQTKRVSRDRRELLRLVMRLEGQLYEPYQA